MWTAEEITNAGERVSHLYANDCYYAHLSIYEFFARYCGDAVVLDAGSGTGYGSAWLADRGARFVYGCELSEMAVQFSRECFPRPNIEFRTASLTDLTGFSPGQFDLICSSNVLEHVPEVTRFFHHACALLKPGGTLALAVPPIVRDADWTENIGNRYHLNLWTPRQWLLVLGQYFKEVETYRHDFYHPGIPLDFSHTPEQTQVKQNDFVFRQIDVGDLYQNFSLSVVMVARGPRPAHQLPRPDAPPALVEGSFSRPLPAPGEPPAGPPEGHQPVIAAAAPSPVSASRWKRLLRRARRFVKAAVS